jgi:hypothetical protein
LRFYQEHQGEDSGLAALRAIRDRNIELLRESGKNLDILKGIYGK